MSLSELCIRRPVLATVVNLLLVLLGLVAFQKLSVREYPDNSVPVVTVTTTYPGATAEIVESDISTVMEQTLSGIEGVDFIRSISRAEQSQITLTFRLNRDPDAAAADVRDRVARSRNQLPEDIDEPVVSKVEADAEPMIWLAIHGDSHSPLEMTDIADRLVKDRLQTLPGVAEVILFAERTWAMRVWIDRMRLAAYGLTVQDVEAAIRSQNIDVPAGRVESEQIEFTVLSKTGLTEPAQFEAIILAERGGYLVRLGDVARIDLGAQAYRTNARFNGVTSVALGIIRQATANPLEVSRAVDAEMTQIRALLPEGLHIDEAFDSAIFIDASIKAVYSTLLEALVLVVLVIFVFLRSLRATFIPLVTIPISLIGACALMWWWGFSVNTLTLLAMVIAIGIVVDDAIVVLENIHRHLEDSLSPLQAAMTGSKEIFFAIIAMTLTLAAVFAPLGFTEGRSGKLFVEFALTLAGAVMISGFVALTLTPMMCHRLLKPEHPVQPGQGRFARFSQRFEHGFDTLVERYVGLSRRLLARPLWSLPVWAVLTAAAIGLLTLLPQELAPEEDYGVIIGIGIAPEGATIDYVDGYAREMEAVFEAQPEIANVFHGIGFPLTTQTIAFIMLKDWAERGPQQDVTARMAGPLFAVPGLLAFAINPPPLGQNASGKPVEVVLQTSGSYEELNEHVAAILGSLSQSGQLENLESDLHLNKPQIELDIDRDRAASTGVDVATIGRSYETLFGGRDVTRFQRGNKKYDVIVQLEPQDRSQPGDLGDLYLRNPGGSLVQLSDLVSVHETVAPRELNHFNKLRAATISATLAPGVALGDALNLIRDTVTALDDPGLRLDYTGMSREFLEASGEIYFTASLALLFIYLVLAAQFESFRDPVIILLSVPFALLGAGALLQLSGGSLNIYSQIGMIALIGLIAKHGIMLVDVANRLRDGGQSVREAMLAACAQRLRPILMTSAAMILGAVPLALASGAGSESRAQIGWVIVGGLSIGTLLTLFVLPALYVLLTKREDGTGRML